MLALCGVPQDTAQLPGGLAGASCQRDHRRCRLGGDPAGPAQLPGKRHSMSCGCASFECSRVVTSIGFVFKKNSGSIDAAAGMAVTQTAVAEVPPAPWLRHLLFSTTGTGRAHAEFRRLQRVQAVRRAAEARAEVQPRFAEGPLSGVQPRLLWSMTIPFVELVCCRTIGGQAPVETGMGQIAVLSEPIPQIVDTGLSCIKHATRRRAHPTRMFSGLTLRKNTHMASAARHLPGSKRTTERTQTPHATEETPRNTSEKHSRAPSTGIPDTAGHHSGAPSMRQPWQRRPFRRAARRSCRGDRRRHRNRR